MAHSKVSTLIYLIQWRVDEGIDIKAAYNTVVTNFHEGVTESERQELLEHFIPLTTATSHPQQVTPMETFTVRQYLEHYQTEYNTRRIRAGLIALLPSTADGTHEFESMNTVFTAYAAELTAPLVMTARTYLGEYHEQYDSSRVLNELVAILPPNGTGLYSIELLRTTFSNYVESIPSLEDYTLPTAPNGSRTMVDPAVIERWKARREAP